MHLHIVGLGAIGNLIAHSLRRALPPKHTITLIHKSIEERQYFYDRRIIRVDRQGEITEASGFVHEVSPAVDDTLTPLAKAKPGEDAVTRNNTPISSLIVTLKAHQTASALEKLAPRLTENSTVVLLQNGMGVYDQVIERVFRNPHKRPHFILGTNNHGAFVKHHFHVVHAGIGSINFGIIPDPNNRDFERGLKEGEDRRLRLADIVHPGDPHAERYTSLRDTVAALMLMSNLNTTWLPMAEVHLLMQRKLVVNAAINPLTALLRCRNGEILKYSRGMRLITSVCSEANAVFEAQWKHNQQRQAEELLARGEIKSVDDVPLIPLPAQLSKEELREEVIAVAKKTEGNISSMLEDIRRGRPTEINYINGYLVKWGKELDIPIPVNKTLTHLVTIRSEMPLDQFL